MGGYCPVEMISGSEMVAIGERNNSQLVMRSARGRIDHHGQIIVSDSRTPIAIFGNKLGLAVAREVTETDESRMA